VEEPEIIYCFTIGVGKPDKEESGEDQFFYFIFWICFSILQYLHNSWIYYQNLMSGKFYSGQIYTYHILLPSLIHKVMYSPLSFAISIGLLCSVAWKASWKMECSGETTIPCYVFKYFWRYHTWSSNDGNPPRWSHGTQRAWCVWYIHCSRWVGNANF